MRLDITKLVLLSALFVGTTTACGKDETETDTNTGTDDEVCDDGEDNDGDGDADCDDSDCDGDADCAATEEFDCDNGDDDDNDGAIDCDDTDCANDNDCEVDYFEPAYFNVEGGFGYDSATGMVVSAISDGNAIAPYLAFVLLEEDYLSTGDEQYVCSVVYIYEGGTPLPLEIMTDADGITHGGFKVDLTDTVAWPAVTDCTEEDDKLLDPEIIADSDAVAWVAAGLTELGMGVGKANADVQTAIDDQVDPADAVFFGGAGVWLNDGTEGGYSTPNYAFGYATDADMNLIVEGDANVPLLAEDYNDASGVPAHGYYQSSLLYVYALQ